MKTKNTWVDYATVKATVNIEDVVRHFGIELPPSSGSQRYAPCFIPGHTGDRSNPNGFSMNPEKGAWRCMSGSCGSGNVIDLYALMTDRDPGDNRQFREAAVEMAERFCGDTASCLLYTSPSPRD